MTHRILHASLIACLAALLTACAAEVGSEAWCEDMAEKPKGDWSVNEAAEYAKSCVFKAPET